MGLGALLSVPGVGYALGGITSGLAGYMGAKSQNKAQSAQASRQMQFQADMSNTAHQREVADLRMAGLNPILSAGGGGASTPSGAMGTQTNAMESVASNARDMTEGILTSRKLNSEKKLTDSTDMKTKTETGLVESQKVTEKAKQLNQLAEMNNKVKQGRLLAHDIVRSATELPTARMRSGMYKKHPWMSKVDIGMEYADKGSKVVGNLADTLLSAVGLGTIFKIGKSTMSGAGKLYRKGINTSKTMGVSYGE